ncbi:ubiquitin-like modifier-activating enzyme 6 [Oscarella lobularis]|uniref:ubiquitin-like modifier-activating enzyme 6 n=1 Tax=Oscarella lobularis TaxID=121494 RepID=UPI0033137D3B
MTTEIDDSLYSRQRYVLGDHAMHRMARSNVFVSGMSGLGVEIAKNVILAGVKSVTLHDVKSVSTWDLGTQFFARDDDVKNQRNRAEACCHHLAELNPYVTVNVSTREFGQSSDLEFLNEYQCVVLTDTSLDVQLKVNAHCRAQDPQIKFVNAGVRGLFCYAFCDFGDDFEVVDQDGEEPREVFISNITKASPGIVTTLENKMHGFQNEDHVKFREVKGMECLNEKIYKIKVVSPHSFSICDTTGEDFGAYNAGGIAIQVKVSQRRQFESLEKQIGNPSLMTVDFGKLERPLQCHVSFLALHQFEQASGHLPEVRSHADAKELVRIAKEISQKYGDESFDEGLVEALAYTARGCLPPFAATLGGFVGQEVLKALTGKFTPLNQWIYFDALELFDEKINSEQFYPKNDRYDALRICIGDDLVQQLANLKLFMIGCGAIGCEMLKNYALLGVATSAEGLITITDNDLIEKSNLNRQFLFRPRHIQQPKSTTAAASTLEINPAIHIDAQQHKVCPQTESGIYTDAFFTRQDLVVNALDNIEARRYVDSRCVTNQRALLESGTMGAKGHVQVVVPHMTESYSSQQDPPDEDVPYCTLKSFPAVIEHTIQWARDKFESAFTQKPQLYNKFWATHKSPAAALEKLKASANLEGVVQVSKMLLAFPLDWRRCVVVARAKFEKFFNHKAQNLLHKFPLTTKLKNGSLFWQSPKRPPRPLIFDSSNKAHLDFITSCARLYANVFGISYTENDLSVDALVRVLSSAPVPQFVPSGKHIETDESVRKPGSETSSASSDAIEACQFKLKKAAEQGVPPARLKVFPATFEKDDDANGHIDFITAASNLRAEMYSIESADRYKTKRIAGRIVPAIATTTAAVAGLVSLELIKVVKTAALEHYKNVFLSLALPVIVFSEPAAAPRTVIMEGLSYTLWDKWEVRGHAEFTLQDFMNHFKGRHGLEPSMVVFGVKMIYVPVMPGHKKRLPQPLLKLIKPAPGVEYVDLTVSFGIPGAEEDKPIPPVRYYFQ